MKSEFKYVKPNLVMSNPKDIIRILDEHGKLIDPNFRTKMTKKQMLEAYKWMVRSRQQDLYMTQLQRQGRMYTFCPNIGEEALQLGIGLNMAPNDWFVPAFRSNALMLYRGVPVRNMFSYWNGSEHGGNVPEGVNVLPVAVQIGTQISHAAGMAYAMKLANKKNKTKDLVVTAIGNGGTTEGEFAEAINMAAIHDWPVCITVNNNQWSISVPEFLETKTTIAAKAAMFGIPGIRVDGNDLLACYEAMHDVLAYIREGNGPVLVEFYTWRQGPHTSSDDPKVYRTRELEVEKEIWEPMKRIKTFLIDHKYWTEKEDEALWASELELVKNEYKESLPLTNHTPIEDVFNYLHATPMPETIKQRDQAIAWFKKGQ